mgnify:FL=1
MTGVLKEGGVQDGDYALNARVMTRYNLSKAWHVQLLGETSIMEENMPRGFSAGLFVRRNF